MDDNLYVDIRRCVTAALLDVDDATPVKQVRAAAHDATYSMMAVTANTVRDLPTKSIDGTPTPYVKLEDVLFMLGQRL